jgi:hypothetical protein
MKLKPKGSRSSKPTMSHHISSLNQSFFSLKNVVVWFILLMICIPEWSNPQLSHASLSFPVQVKDLYGNRQEQQKKAEKERDASL